MKINIEWQAFNYEGLEEQRLLVSTDMGHDLMYIMQEGLGKPGPDLNNSQEVLKMVLSDLGFDVKSNV
jgi:hypothetical protein